MGLIKLLLAPVRRVINFPLFQLVVVIAVILVLQAADSSSILGRLFTGLDSLVDFTVNRAAAIFEVKSFTKSWLVTGFMIAYVYLAGLLILYLLRLLIMAIVDRVALNNAFGLRNAIARERGIAAYRAWLPFESIRPPQIPQQAWEERFAWPADNRPPYPPLAQRVLRAVVTYVAALLLIAALLELFTPLPALSWLGSAVRRLVGV